MREYESLYDRNRNNGRADPRAAFPPLPGPGGRCPFCTRRPRGCCCRCTPCPPAPCCPCTCPPCPECGVDFHQVIFDATGGAPTPPPQTVPHGQRLTRPQDPQKAGYTFTGWYQAVGLSVAPWDFDADVVTSDMILYAGWMPLYFQITFDATGGVPTPASQTAPYGGRLVRPVDPARIGYNFTGWYTAAGLSGLAWDFDADVVVGDMTLYAGWTPAFFQVSFDTNGGMPIPAPQTVPYSGKVVRPADPLREDYVFVAWYATPALIGTPWIFGTDMVLSDLTLYARWLQPAS